MKYEKVSSGSWEKGDIKGFHIPTISENADYDIYLLLRTDSSFPYTNIAVTIDETVFPSRKRHLYTLDYALYDEKGKAKGNGISLFQQSLLIDSQHLYAGDEISIAVNHNMRRETLPGVIDVGISIKRR